MEFKIFIFLWRNVQTSLLRQLLHETEFSSLPKLTLAKKQPFQQLPASTNRTRWRHFLIIWKEQTAVRNSLLIKGIDPDS